jgi:5'-3' exonuclease
LKRLILIDLSGLYWSSWHSTADQELSAAFERTVGKVHKLREGFDLCAVCCDAPPYKRKKLAPSYKANRDAHPPQALEQFARTKERLVADGFLLWAAQGYEADDVIATAVGRAIADELEVVIASSDKDLYALVDDARHVSALSLATGQMVNESTVREKFEVAPVLVPELLALWGDASDNVPGVPGVGVKTAAKLLEAHGPTVEDVIANADAITSERLKKAIFASVDSIRLARELVRLCADVPLKWEELYAERKPTPITAGRPDVFDADFEEEEPPVPAAEKQPEPETKSEPKPRAKPLRQAQLATVPVEYSKALEPVDTRDAFTIAKHLFESRLYQRYGTPQAIFAIILRGREMGLGALTSLDAFHNFEGKPLMHAHLIIARAKADPDCEYFQFLSGDHEHAEYETKVRCNPKPTRLRYTIEQAREAGLIRPNGNWAKRPDEMLRKTCAVQLARIEYPSAAMGLYCAEEMGVEL